MRTDNTPPILISSPDPKSCSGHVDVDLFAHWPDSLIKLPGVSARISPTVKLHWPSSG